MVLANVTKILVVELGGIGDLLIALPSLAALRRAYPEAACDALVIGRVRELAEKSGVFDRVHCLGHGLVPAIRAIWRARQERYDLVINMRPIARAMAAVKIAGLLALIGGKAWAGRDTDGRGCFFQVSVPEPLRALKHDSEYAADLMAALGAPVTDKTVRMSVDAASEGAVALRLRGARIADTDIVVGIHAGGMPSHRWPVERFSEVMRILTRTLPCVFVLTGTARERAYVSRLTGEASIRTLNLAGELSVKELAALIKRCDLYIANDTGPIHIAAALGRPLIAIFGPGDFKRFDPRVLSRDAVVFYKPAACAPCDRPRCSMKRCLLSVTAEEVAAAALRILADRGL